MDWQTLKKKKKAIIARTKNLPGLSLKRHRSILYLFFFFFFTRLNKRPWFNTACGRVTNGTCWINYSERYVGEGTAVVFDLLWLEKLSLQLVNTGRKVFSRLILPLIHLLKPFTGRELCHFIHAHVWYSLHMPAHSLKSVLTQVIKENGMLFLARFYL